MCETLVRSFDMFKVDENTQESIIVHGSYGCRSNKNESAFELPSIFNNCCAHLTLAKYDIVK